MSELRRAENEYYPPALRESAPVSSEANTVPEAAKSGQDSATNDPIPLGTSVEETEHPGVPEKEKIIHQEIPQDVMKPLADLQAPSFEKEAPKKTELVSASLAEPLKVTPPSHGTEASDTAFQQPSKDKLTIKLKK